MNHPGANSKFWGLSPKEFVNFGKIKFPKKNMPPKINEVGT